MIIVSVLYPNGPKARFDVDYYTRKHMPMVQQRLGTPLRRVVVEQGIAGAAPGDALLDIPNYTSAQPVIQIGEVRV